ncbi:MAG: dephospho-CoA kinase [Chloroflexota bacterium]
MTTITINKLIIGLTGNIATGKSAVLRLAAEKGALIIDADKLVHDLLNYDADMQSAIALAFGPEVRREDGRIDRRALGEIVFQDADALHDLEMMIHPAVRRTIFERVSQSEAAITMIEAIKLLEGDLATVCDQIWVTRCSPKRQMQRLVICRGLDQETARQRIEAQPPQSEKVAQADVVIETDGLMQGTETQFELAWSRLPDLEDVAAKTLTLPDTQIPFADQAASQTAAAPVRPATSRPVTAGQGISPAPPLPLAHRPENLDIRRARPSDIPSILLLMQQATDGAIKMKRADLLMALGERSYFIGQLDGDVKAVFGWNIENLVASVDQIYIYPPEETAVIGPVILEEIEVSADQHLGEIVVIFLPPDHAPELRQLLAGRHYNAVTDINDLPKVWQAGIKEHQPEGTEFFIRILRERVTQPQ